MGSESSLISSRAVGTRRHLARDGPPTVGHDGGMSLAAHATAMPPLALIVTDNDRMAFCRIHRTSHRRRRPSAPCRSRILDTSSWSNGLCGCHHIPDKPDHYPAEAPAGGFPYPCRHDRSSCAVLSIQRRWSSTRQWAGANPQALQPSERPFLCHRTSRTSLGRRLHSWCIAAAGGRAGKRLLP